MTRRAILLILATLALPLAARADQLDDNLAAAKALLLAGKTDDASIQLAALQARAQAAIDANPADHHALYILGSTCMLIGDDTIAGSALARAVRLQPMNLQYALARAQLADMQGKSAEAIGLFKNALAIDPKSVEAWTELGLAQRQASQFTDAQTSFEKAAEFAPKDPKFPGLIAQTLADQHKYDDAIATYNKALTLDPKYAAAWSGIGQAHEAKLDAAAALAAYIKAVELTPDDYRLIAKQVQLNEALGKTKDRDAARDRILALQKAGKIDGTSFCRQIFGSGKSAVMAFEYLDPKLGEVRYSFTLVSTDGKTVEQRIVLVPAMQMSPASTMFDLDAYTATTVTHIKKFTAEPTYELTRDAVQQYLAGKIPPLSTEPLPGAAK